MQTPKLITINNKTYLGTIDNYSIDPNVSREVIGLEVSPNHIMSERLRKYFEESLLDGLKKISLIGEYTLQVEDLDRDMLAYFDKLSKILDEAKDLKDNFITLLCFERLLGK